MRKTLYYNYKKYIKFRKFCFFITESIRNVFLLHLCLRSFEKFFWDGFLFFKLGLKSALGSPVVL